MTAGSVSVPSKLRARWPIFAGLAVAVLVADQVTKAWLVSFLSPGQRTEVIGPYVRLVHSQNTGALFGLFRDQAAVFAVVSVGVVGESKRSLIWLMQAVEATASATISAVLRSVMPNCIGVCGTSL